MIDTFFLLLTHVLLILVAVRAAKLDRNKTQVGSRENPDTTPSSDTRKQEIGR